MRIRSKVVLSVTTLVPVCAMALPAGALPAFSTAAKNAPDPHPSHLTQFWRIRPANDSTFDRVVFDERFSPSGYHVHYVRQVRSDGSGKPVTIKGRYFLSVSIPGTSTGGAAGTPTFIHHVLTPNLPDVVQIKKSGEFENVVSFGIGLRHRNGFRVFRLHAPERLVIDILH